jgi:hypothetical protein
MISIPFREKTGRRIQENVDSRIPLLLLTAETVELVGGRDMPCTVASQDGGHSLSSIGGLVPDAGATAFNVS